MYVVHCTYKIQFHTEIGSKRRTEFSVCGVLYVQIISGEFKNLSENPELKVKHKHMLPTVEIFSSNKIFEIMAVIPFESIWIATNKKEY